MLRYVRRIINLIRNLERISSPNFINSEVQKAFIDTFTDTKNIQDILQFKKHFPKNWEKNLIIYDVGMHSGQDTDFYLKKGFKVVAIEANPHLCEEGRKRFADYLKDGRLTIVNKGISRSSSKAIFYVNEEKSVWSSFEKNTAGRKGHALKEVEVECCTLAEVVKEHGSPYCIKIDIEGHDEIALQSLIDNNLCPPYISVENGTRMLDLLKDRYPDFKFIQQNNVHKIKLSFPSLEGKFVDHQFELGSSGPFGEETAGSWKKYEEVYYDISKVWNINTGEKNPLWNDSVHGWFDLHARSKDFKNDINNLLKN